MTTPQHSLCRRKDIDGFDTLQNITNRFIWSDSSWRPVENGTRFTYLVLVKTSDSDGPISHLYVATLAREEGLLITEQPRGLRIYLAGKHVVTGPGCSYKADEILWQRVFYRASEVKVVPL